MNLAICFFCKSNSLLDGFVQDLFTGHSTTIFEDTDTDLSKSMYGVYIKKREFEINTRTEFDVCIAINGSVDNIDKLHLIPKIEKDTLYYTSGRLRQRYSSIIVSLDSFYANSETFDRACEYVCNVNNLKKIEKVRENFTEGERFYSHLKSLMLNTRCINIENSDMFIRSTEIY